MTVPVTASEAVRIYPQELRPRTLLMPQIDLGNIGTQLGSTTHLLGSCARSFVHARSAERPNIAVADALGSPSSESRCARLDAEQAPGQRASKSSRNRRTVVLTASPDALHHLETAWSIYFLIICF